MRDPKKPIHTEAEVAEKMDEWLERGFFNPEFHGGDIVLALVESEGLKGVLRREEGQPPKVLHVDGESELVIGLLMWEENRYRLEPVGWEPGKEITARDYRSAALEAWKGYYLCHK